MSRGTKLGPILFTAFDFRLCTDNELRANFVYDLILPHLFRIDICDRIAVQYPQQASLNTLSLDCTDRGMEPNTSKSEVLYPLLPEKRPLTLPDLQLCGEPLPVVESVKLMGVRLNNQLPWETHVNYIITKACKSIFMLVRAKKLGFSQRTILTLYIWFVRTVLEYAAQVWHSGLTQQQQERIERVQ